MFRCWLPCILLPDPAYISLLDFMRIIHVTPLTRPLCPSAVVEEYLPNLCIRTVRATWIPRVRFVRSQSAGMTACCERQDSRSQLPPKLCLACTRINGNFDLFSRTQSRPCSMPLADPRPVSGGRAAPESAALTRLIERQPRFVLYWEILFHIAKKTRNESAEGS